MFKKKIFQKFRLGQRKYSASCSESSWQSIVGLEIHAQIQSVSKLFSGASTKFASPVNNNVSLFDCAIPGTLPVLNKRCVEAGVLTALALKCKVHPVSYFDRKHYFYADLPTGYQITQQRAPLASNGYLEFQVFSPGVHKKPYKAQVKLKQLQLEQDSGKSLHDEDKSLVDLNRAGVPLMELVFEPDLKDGEEAASLIKELIFILKRIHTCSCKMEEGALRVDANVSVNRIGEPLGVRTEIKNIGSVRAVANAVKYEIQRQINVKESGGTVINETRGWDVTKKATIAMRDKEVVQDYRYMPEPNLPPLHIGIGPIERGCVHVNDLRNRIPEMPEDIRQRLMRVYGLTLEQSIRLVNDLSLLELFEDVINKQSLNEKLLANFIFHILLSVLKKRDLDLADVELSSDQFAEAARLFLNGTINRAGALLVVEEIVFGSKQSPIKFVENQDLFQITDNVILKKLCEEAMREKPKAVQDYKKGKTKAFFVLTSLISKNSNDKADMAKATTILKDLLEK